MLIVVDSGGSRLATRVWTGTDDGRARGAVTTACPCPLLQGSRQRWSWTRLEVEPPWSDCQDFLEKSNFSYSDAAFSEVTAVVPSTCFFSTGSPATSFAAAVAASSAPVG